MSDQDCQILNFSQFPHYMSIAVKPLDGNFLSMANAHIVSSNTNTTDLSLTMFLLQ